MSKTLKVSLTDELSAYVDQNSGDGTLYATPSEFVRQVLREKKEQQESADMREAIIAGYQDAIAGRIHKFEGNLRKVMKKVRH